MFLRLFLNGWAGAGGNGMRRSFVLTTSTSRDATRDLPFRVNLPSGYGEILIPTNISNKPIKFVEFFYKNPPIGL